MPAYRPYLPTSTYGVPTPQAFGAISPEAGSNTILYTVPVKNLAQITTLTVCNESAITVKIRIGLDINGLGTGEPISGEWIYYDLDLDAHNTILLDAAQGLWLAAGTDLTVYSNLGSVSFIASGVEFT